jgi:hypothetical protein
MSPSDDDLRFNVLHRLSKRSPRLVLEEYGHWEVPVGCGGILLQWRDPADGHLFVVQVATLGTAQVHLDGHLVEQLLLMKPGPHELWIEITDLPDHPSPFGLELLTRMDDDDPQSLLSSAAGGFLLREGAADQGRALEPFEGDLAQATQGRTWWFQTFEGGALLSLPPKRALLYRKLEVIDARTLR